MTINKFQGTVEQLQGSINFSIRDIQGRELESSIAEVNKYADILWEVSLTCRTYLLVASSDHKENVEQLRELLHNMQQEMETLHSSREKFIRDFTQKDTKIDNLFTNTDQTLKSYIERSKQSEDRATKAWEKAESKSEQTKNEIERALLAARQYAAEKALAPYTHSFSDAATNWKTIAIWWLIATCIVLIATSVWAYYGIKGTVPNLSNTAHLVQYFSSRLLITALLISAFWWSAKQYRIAMHQKTSNQHKADALRSFEAFIEATNSPDVRNAVILQTSQTIFGQQPTGYLDGKEESSFEQYTKVAQSINSAAHAITKNS